MTRARFQYEALLFDMDGLLVDSEPVWFRAERALAESRGGTWSDALAHRCVGTGIGATLAIMRDELGLAVDPERDADVLVDRFIELATDVPLKAGARELLDAAAHLPLGLATSSPLRLARAVLGGLGLFERFAVVCTRESVRRPKPAPDIYLEAARGLGVAPSRTVVLEDSLSGARAGKAAGAFVIAVPEWERGGFGEAADAVVADLAEARALLGL